MRTVTILFVLAAAASVCNGQWVQTNLDSGNVMCFAISPDAGGNNLFAGDGWDGVFLSTDDGDSWTAVNFGLEDSSVYALAVKGSYLFAGTYHGRVFRSTNNGSSWEAVSSGLPDTNLYAFAVSDSNLFAGGAAGVFLSTNNGGSWTAVNSGLLDTRVHALAVSGSNLFAGGIAGVFLSTNNGSTWVRVNSGPPALVLALAVSGSHIFAGTKWDGVFLSTNNGGSWMPVNSGLLCDYVGSLSVSGNNLFATSEDVLGSGGCGVFLSINNGTNWTDISAGLPNVLPVWTLWSTEKFLFAGVYESGVWKRPLSEVITDVESEVQLPTHFSLSKNYPNPFNPSTSIRYGLPLASFVTLTVYNTLGQEVTQLVNGEQQAGYHDVVFRGDGLASGVYFYRLQAGDFVASKKLLLLK